jgi:hypothetical protein
MTGLTDCENDPYRNAVARGETMNHQDVTNSGADRGTIEVRIREIRQLFDAMDPSPFREKDLDPNAEEYIVESLKEHPSREPCALVVHLDQPTGLPDETDLITEAVRVHFARRALVFQRKLQRLMRRGVISLAIGIAFLVAIFGIVHLIRQFLGEGAVALLSREGLIIVGWVAMWRPLEIFLYDWWPILGEKRIRERLSRIEVKVVRGGAPHRDDLARLLSVNGQ